MDICPACGKDYYHNPEVRMLSSAVCGHRVCEPCVARLFQHRPTYPCTECGRSLRAGDYTEQTLEARQVEEETRVRRQIGEIYNQCQDDFADAEAYDNYLEEREDMIYAALHAQTQEEQQELWRRIEAYRQRHAAQILRAKGEQQSKKAHRVQQIINEEGAFCNMVNAEWGERPKQMEHPFVERYRDLLTKVTAEAPEVARTPPDSASPGAPQPLLSRQSAADRARHMSGGGCSPDLHLKKSWHFLLAELRDAAATGESAVMAN